MGSNPSTESNYKTAVNSKNKMQMLCMQPGTTAEGYNQGREPKNLMHSSTEICNRISVHANRRIWEMRVRSHRSPSYPGKKTESNYKTAVNSKNKMQMLCMQPGTTAEGYNQGREPKNLMHSSTEICNRISVHARSPRDLVRNLKDATHGRRQQLRDLALANNSIQEWYSMEELLERSPTVPQTYKTMARNDGNHRIKSTMNSTRVRRTEVDNRENISLRIQLAVGPQPLRLRNHNFGLAQRIMVKRLTTWPHDPLGITDSACKNQLVVVSVQYGPFNTYIPIRSTTIGKSRVARDPIAMHTSWRSNSDIASIAYDIHTCKRAVNPRQRSIHSYMHRDLTQSRRLMTPKVKEMKRRRAGQSADGLALMTSSYSADGLREQSQESADSAGRLCVDNSAVASYSGSSRNAKISRRSVCVPRRKKINLLLLKKIQAKQLMNQTQATAASSRELQCYCISSRLGTQTQEKKKQAKCRDSTSRELQNPVARKEDVAKLCNQAQSFQSTKISAEDEFSRSDKSATKQLTTYEEFTRAGCQLLSSIQMEKTTRSLQKKRTQVLFPVGTLQDTFQTGRSCVQRD
ncbi:hypothetical protein F511_15019 [Dorcoceras hygrometricum]|uniref:Uncharacterized protein n=1 Tax=Dorcoceras hygrometricum TaxID=472368 RepID=A0A2Z7AAY6_9LAMI|nr:hypothetical protein F511_15019 [Dorcoceras hygrometricum]